MDFSIFKIIQRTFKRFGQICHINGFHNLALYQPQNKCCALRHRSAGNINVKHLGVCVIYWRKIFSTRNSLA